MQFTKEQTKKILIKLGWSRKRSEAHMDRVCNILNKELEEMNKTEEVKEVKTSSIKKKRKNIFEED